MYIQNKILTVNEWYADLGPMWMMITRHLVYTYVKKVLLQGTMMWGGQIINFLKIILSYNLYATCVLRSTLIVLCVASGNAIYIYIYIFVL